MVLAARIGSGLGAGLLGRLMSAIGRARNTAPSKQVIALDRNTSTASFKLRVAGDSAVIKIDGKEAASIYRMDDGRLLASRKTRPFGSFGASQEELLFLRVDNRAYQFNKLELRRKSDSVEVRILQQYLGLKSANQRLD